MEGMSETLTVNNGLFTPVVNDHNYCPTGPNGPGLCGQNPSDQDVEEGQAKNCWQTIPIRNKRHLALGNSVNFKKPCTETEASNVINLRNSFDVLSDGKVTSDTEMNQDQDASVEVRPPPIFVPNISNIKNMIESIESVITKDSYSYKCITRDKVKINTLTIDDYRTLVKHLTELKVGFHTYQIKKDRAYRVVLKNMHFSTDLKDIKEAIESHGHAVRNVSNLKSRSKDPLSIFFVDLEPAPNNKNIFTVEFLLNAKIVFEPPRKRNDVVQCKKCQRYGHTKSYCWYTNRCVKCGSDHDTSTCSKSVHAPPKCVLCGGEHPANYKGCSVYRDIKSKSFPSLRSNGAKETVSSQGKSKVDTFEISRKPATTDIRGSSTASSPLSYAAVTSGRTKSDEILNLNQMIEGFLNKFEVLMSQQAQQVSTLINLLTTVISKLK